jgi:hypothetical protein
LDITWGICTRNRRSKIYTKNFHEFLGCSTENCFRTARGFSWHKNEIKRIRSSYYNSNNFQDSNKRKCTKSKIMGYLPRVLFFNAFELGSVI